MDILKKVILIYIILSIPLGILEMIYGFFGGTINPSLMTSAIGWFHVVVGAAFILIYTALGDRKC